MSSKQLAIQVENLGKSYHIYNQPQDRLKQSILPRFQRLAGRQSQNYFREFWALRNVSFEVMQGETVGIIGRNGSGKSTLLQLICGTLTPTMGTVRTNGRIAALLELGSGFNPEFSGRENVFLNGSVLGLAQEEIDSRFDDIAAFADIGDFIDQPVKTYSSGMVVRLAFAVQAMVDPDILIVDEALAVGDEKFQRKCFARLDELKSNGTSILFVSHSGPQIVELCEKVLLLERGESLMLASPLQAVRAYQKLIYASIADQEQLVQEYKLSSRSEEVSSMPNKLGSFQTEVEHKAFYDPALIPQTTEIYPSQGARIESCYIFDNNGYSVNVLIPGQEYQFQVNGSFFADNDKIYFGIHLRSISGVSITGQRYPEEGSFIKRSVCSGETFSITYRFKMILVPGVYFVGVGVWTLNEPNCLHRILDALMFRVTQKQKPNALGYVDASLAEPVLVINKSP